MDMGHTGDYLIPHEASAALLWEEITGVIWAMYSAYMARDFFLGGGGDWESRQVNQMFTFYVRMLLLIPLTKAD